VVRRRERRVRYFVAIAETGSLTLAAETRFHTAGFCQALPGGSATTRALAAGEQPTIDWLIGYHRATISQILKKFRNRWPVRTDLRQRANEWLEPGWGLSGEKARFSGKRTSVRR
jgi:hypothetical protein